MRGPVPVQYSGSFFVYEPKLIGSEEDYFLHRIDLSTAAPVWSLSISQGKSENRTPIRDFWPSGDTLYLVDDMNLYAIDAKAGEIARKVALLP